MFDAERFCMEYSIPTAPRGHQHKRRGWANVCCPFCGPSSGYHMGINMLKGYSVCYKHGYSWLPKTVAALAKTTLQQAFVILTKYSTGEVLEDYKTQIKRKDKLELPAGVGPMQKMHWDYLKSRSFSASTAREWELLGGGLHGKQAFRIVAPIRLDGVLISYQGRDVTGNSKQRYKMCELEEEVYPCKSTIYGIDKCKGDKILIVEGITDTWRIGPGCGSTFGIEWMPAQARMIANRFKSFIILFDAEDQAQEKASELYNYLTARGLEGEIAILNIGKDPGELTDKLAKEIRGDFGL